MAALQISVSPASGQMGHIRPVCAGEGTKTSQRHLELPHLSLTDPGGEPVHIWDSPGCLTFPPMSPQRGVCPDALEGTYFWAMELAKQQHHLEHLWRAFLIQVGFLFVKQWMQTRVHVVNPIYTPFVYFRVHNMYKCWVMKLAAHISWKSRRYLRPFL